MTLIKVVLIAAAVLVLAWAFRNRHRVGLRAGSRLAALGLTVLAVISIAYPRITQDVADFVGVGRGTDLLLYVLIVVFTLTTAGLYFRFRESERRLAQVVRIVAIGDAVAADGLPGAEQDSL